MFFALVSLIIITMVLYAGVMLVPPEARAELYIPEGKSGKVGVSENFVKMIIKSHHLDDPYLVQYGYWVKSLISGSWGYSPTLGEGGGGLGQVVPVDDAPGLDVTRTQEVGQPLQEVLQVRGPDDQIKIVGDLNTAQQQYGRAAVVLGCEKRCDAGQVVRLAR